MFTNEEAEALIKVEKKLEDPSQILDLGRQKNRINLRAPKEPDYKFFVEITSNQRIQFKISLHHQESYSNVGLVRLDIKGRHKNPERANVNLPHKFKPYIGKFFEKNEPHIHFYVEGAKPLAWAVPLNDLKIPTQNVDSMSDFNDIIRDFNNIINVVSSLEIQPTLI